MKSNDYKVIINYLVTNKNNFKYKIKVVIQKFYFNTLKYFNIFKFINLQDDGKSKKYFYFQKIFKFGNGLKIFESNVFWNKRIRGIFDF